MHRMAEEVANIPIIQKTTPREFKPRISRTKGHLSKRTAFVREIVKEVSGYVEIDIRSFKIHRG